MTIREKRAHEDCYRLADPETLGRGKKFLRKAEKTAWSMLDHKKAKVAVVTGTIAANVAIAIATAGVSLPAQFAIAIGASVAAGGADKTMNHILYKSNKKKLKNVDVNALKRTDTRASAENFEHNETYLKTALSRTIIAYRKLLTHQQALRGPNATAIANSQAQVKAILVDMYTFYVELDQLLHYYNQFVEFLDFSRRFGDKIRLESNQRKNSTDSATRQTVAKNLAWHGGQCRTSRIRKDVCYGQKSGAMADVPYHTV